MKNKIKKIILPAFIFVFAFFAYSNSANAQTEYFDYVLESNVAFADMPHDEIVSAPIVERKETVSTAGGYVPYEFSKEEPEEPEVDFATKFQTIVTKQNFSIEQIRTATEELDNRSKLTDFLVGSRLVVLKFQIAQIQEHMYALEALDKEATTDEEHLMIRDNLKILVTEKFNAEVRVEQEEHNFSLLGWLIALK